MTPSLRGSTSAPATRGIAEEHWVASRLLLGGARTNRVGGGWGVGGALLEAASADGGVGGHSTKPCHASADRASLCLFLRFRWRGRWACGGTSWASGAAAGAFRRQAAKPEVSGCPLDLPRVVEMGALGHPCLATQCSNPPAPLWGHQAVGRGQAAPCTSTSF